MVIQEWPKEFRHLLLDLTEHEYQPTTETIMQAGNKRIRKSGPAIRLVTGMTNLPEASWKRFLDLYRASKGQWFKGKLDKQSGSYVFGFFREPFLRKQTIVPGEVSEIIAEFTFQIHPKSATILELGDV